MPPLPIPVPISLTNLALALQWLFNDYAAPPEDSHLPNFPPVTENEALVMAYLLVRHICDYQQPFSDAKA